jgi:two-component system sensor histidine kinase/response regulator
MNSPVPGRLLIVDDEPAQMQALHRTLENDGYVVAGFTSGRQALEHLRQQSFDVLLTDLSMPDTDGIELLRLAQAIDANLVGIVMTGHGSIESAVAAMKAGALDYVLKPFTLKTMRPVLQRALMVRRLMTENQELRRTEDTMRRLNVELERQVDERTHQLTEANRELEAFSHSISHDLRAPLRAINGFGNVLIEEYGAALDDRARGYLDRILSAGTRMEQLIGDLMRLSHASVTEVRTTDVDLTKLAQQAINDLRERDPNRVIDVDIEPGMTCKGDPQLLRIALENLLGNAWKFTQKVASPKIVVGRKPGTDDTFFVRDNGAGFEPAQAKNLFTPFRRLHSASQFPGTGVGLSIVQRIVRRHGGRISAEAEVDKGAAFTFSLPDPARSTTLNSIPKPS